MEIPRITPEIEASTDGEEAQRSAKVPLPSEPEELIRLLLDEREDLTRRRKVYGALDRIIRKSPSVLSSVVDLGQFGDAPLLSRWLAAELTLARPLAPARLAHILTVRATLPEDAWNTMIRVARSTWISERGYPAQAIEVAKTNVAKLEAPPPKTRLDFHPLLAVDESHRWPPQHAERFDDALLIDDKVDSELQVFASLGFPISREIVARRGLLEIRAPRSAAHERPVSRATRDSLALLVQAITEAIKDGLSDADQMTELLRLIRFAGRSPELWALLDRQRAILTRAAPEDSAVASHWALAMGEMPSTSSGVVAALAEVPDTSLMALLEVCIDRMLSSFVGHIQDIALARARSGTASTTFWLRLSKIAPLTPQLERWWRAYMASMAPSGSVTLDPATRSSLLIDELRSCTALELTSSELTGRIVPLAAPVRLHALGTAIHRLTSEIPAERDRQINRLVSRSNGDREQIEAALTTLRERLGRIPASIAVVADNAKQVLETERERLLNAGGSVAALETRRFAPRRVEDITDIVVALHRIDRPASDKVQREEMARLREHIAWASQVRPDLLGSVVAELPTFSGEALSVVVAVAMQQKDRHLFDAISSNLSAMPALRLIWRASLVAHASQLGTTIRFDDQLADLSTELLVGQLRELQQRLREVRAEATWLGFTAKGATARHAVRSSVEELASDLASVAARL